MPPKLRAKLRKFYHQLLRTKVIRLSGVSLDARHPGISRMVRNQLYRGTYEMRESLLVHKYLQSSDRVVEIGCGIGFIGCLCAKIIGSDQVFSYEANPNLEHVIRANYNLNRVNPCLTMHAVTRDGADVVIHVADNQISTSAISRNNVNTSPLTVKSTSLSEILVEIKPTIVVMDVEGLEVDLLASPLELDDVRLIIAETHPHIVGTAKIDAMNNYLEEAGFRIADANDKVVVYAQ
jgi:FkbM family methyltransferase